MQNHVLNSSILACKAVPLVSIEETSEILSSSEEDYEKWFENKALTIGSCGFSNEAFRARKQRWQRFLDSSTERKQFLFGDLEPLDVEAMWSTFNSSHEVSVPSGSFFDLFMRHMFQIDAHSIFHGRKVALVPNEAHLAVVPPASRSGDVIYVIYTGDGIYAVVLRPCEDKVFGDADETTVREKLWDWITPITNETCAKHFLFIGVAWVDLTLLGVVDSINDGKLEDLPKQNIALH
jgi:hypothetical protein